MGISRKDKAMVEHSGLVYRAVGSVLGPVPYCPPEIRAELIGAGFLGLVTASSKYDRRRGKFSTYAYPVIRGFVLDALKKETGWLLGWVEMGGIETEQPEGLISLRELSREQATVLWEIYGKGHSIEQAARRLKLSQRAVRKRVVEAKKALRAHP